MLRVTDLVQQFLGLPLVEELERKQSVPYRWLITIDSVYSAIENPYLKKPKRHARSP